MVYTEFNKRKKYPGFRHRRWGGGTFLDRTETPPPSRMTNASRLANILQPTRFYYTAEVDRGEGNVIMRVNTRNDVGQSKPIRKKYPITVTISSGSEK